MGELIEKRFDPRMHSAEHILNQTMIRMLNTGRCFSAHIEKKKSKADYYFDRSLTDEEVREIERRVNEVIQADMTIREEYLERTKAVARYNLARLPADSGDHIRIVHIGDYDACPCIGPHVGSTREIGPFRLISTAFDDGVLRIRYKLAMPSTTGNIQKGGERD